MTTISLKQCDFYIHSPRDPGDKGWPDDLMTLDGLRDCHLWTMLVCSNRPSHVITIASVSNSQ